ncbi:MAG: hypothetical protein IKP66_00755 [Lachnospiraceae bacterium]|nr:hypothetical protein [Lachnospiraceae bacterium]
MNWNKQMQQELNKAGLNVKMTRVPKSRRTTDESIADLNAKIRYRLNENKGMLIRSMNEGIY